MLSSITACSHDATVDQLNRRSGYEADVLQGERRHLIELKIFPGEKISDRTALHKIHQHGSNFTADRSVNSV